MGRKTPETNIVLFQGEEIPQTVSLKGPRGIEDVFLNPVAVEEKEYQQKLVLEGLTPRRSGQIGGRVRVDYFTRGNKIFKAERIYAELDDNSVLSQFTMTYKEDPVELIYSIQGSPFVTPRLNQDPDNYDLDVLARLVNQPKTFPALAHMEYRNPPTSYPYRAFITSGEWKDLLAGHVEQGEVEVFGKRENDWRKLRYHFMMGRGWTVMDEKLEYRGHGVPVESYKNILANSKRRSRVATSVYSFKVGHKEVVTPSISDDQLSLQRFNTQSKSLWTFTIPTFLNRRQALDEVSVGCLDNFIHYYPVSLAIHEKSQPKRVFSTKR